MIIRGREADARDRLARNDENMVRCLRGDIPEGDAKLILVHEGGRDFLRADFFKKCFHRPPTWQPGASWQGEEIVIGKIPLRCKFAKWNTL